MSSLTTTTFVVNANLYSQRTRGRPIKTETGSKTSTKPGLTTFQKAKNLRNSALALNSSSKKRKLVDEEEEYDSDDSPDAQLARALQEQENRKVIDDSEAEESLEDFLPRSTRSGRPLRPIRPRSGYVLDASEETETEAGPSTRKTSSKAAGKFKNIISDSEGSDFVASDDEIASFDNSRSSSEVPLAQRVASAMTENGKAEDFKARMSQFVASQHSRSRGQGQSLSLSNRPNTNIKTKTALGSINTVPDTRMWREITAESSVLSERALDDMLAMDSDAEMIYLDDLPESDDDDDDSSAVEHRRVRGRRNMEPGEIISGDRQQRRAQKDRARLELQHPELLTMWEDMKNLPSIKRVQAEQPKTINRELKPFQLEGLSWMQAMEKTEWGGGLLGDEMGMGKTIQAVSLIMSDYPAKTPSLVLIPPVALMQWQQEIGEYTDGTLKTFVFHGTNLKSKNITVKELKEYDVILMSYNSLESMYRHQEKGFKRKGKIHHEKSVIHQIQFHRVILDEAHNIKQRTTGVAKACFALKADHKWCLSGTPLQNRIGELFSLVRFLDIQPFACYFCKQCPCSNLEWSMNVHNRCTSCNHTGMQHVSVFNQELLNPIQKFGNKGPGKVAFEKLRLLTDRFMLRRVKRDHSSAMELPAKEIYVDRQFFGEEENDFAGSIMNNGTRRFETYVAQGVLLNNYANIFGLIMQMRQVADHPDLILKKNGEGGQNIFVCCICDETAEDAIRSICRHDFCRACVKSYINSSEESGSVPDCPSCHIPLSIDLEQPEMAQDEQMVKKSSIINRIKMENWTSSSKIEALVHDLHSLRSNKSSSKSIIFSQFTTMLQLVEWRLRRAGITTVMLDGSMTPAQRQASINHFMTNVDVECFLVSLKAGGVALNLTEASKVFIVDP